MLVLEMSIKRRLVLEFFKHGKPVCDLRMPIGCKSKAPMLCARCPHDLARAADRRMMKFDCSPLWGTRVMMAPMRITTCQTSVEDMLNLLIPKPSQNPEHFSPRLLEKHYSNCCDPSDDISKVLG
jgi:hypothetical protein